MRIGDALTEVDRPINMRDSEVYELVSIRRRNGGMFHRESLPGCEILTKTLREVVPGTFVIARMQIVHGASALAPDDFAGCAISKSYSSFRGTPRCDVNYFSWLAKLPFMYAYFLDSSHGVVIEKMTFDQQRWMSLPVYLPPLTEQRRIAAILDRLDQEIRSSEQLIAKLHQIHLGLQHDLLTRGLNDLGEVRDPVHGTDLFAESPLGMVPKAWEVLPLRDVVPTVEYGISHSLDGEGGTPVLRMNNLANGEVVLDEVKTTAFPVPEQLILRPGDVLFNRTNSIDQVGRTGIWRGQIPGATFASYLVRLNPAPGRLDNEYLNRWLNLPETQIRIRAYATPGVHQVNINPTNLRRVRIALPGSLHEQHEICDRLMASDERRMQENAQLHKLRSLRAGLMNDLLTGRVRVSETEDAA
jgi:type I restriction enzyme S subunit